jgi:hypothetical protein
MTLDRGVLMAGFLLIVLAVYGAYFAIERKVR